jgi:hypothetical protein
VLLANHGVSASTFQRVLATLELWPQFNSEQQRNKPSCPRASQQILLLSFAPFEVLICSTLLRRWLVELVCFVPLELFHFVSYNALSADRNAARQRELSHKT